jgi:hypothetical protein
VSDAKPYTEKEFLRDTGSDPEHYIGDANARRLVATVRTLDAATARIAELEATSECLRALASTSESGTYLPLHWREAVARGDVAACRELGAKSRETIRTWQEGCAERDEWRTRAKKAEAEVAEVREALKLSRDNTRVTGGKS